MSDAMRCLTKNCVLAKDDVGRAKHSTFDLPAEDFSYGRPDLPDFEGAREVTMRWAAHVPSLKKEPSTVDFKRMNRLAAAANVTSAKSLAEFRKGSDDAVVVIPHPVTRAPVKVLPSDVVKSFAYGSKTRPSTPIQHVVSGQYGFEYEQVLQSSYEQYDVAKVGRPLRVRMTKAANQRKEDSRRGRHGELEEPKEPFKLSKFKKVPARLKLPDAFATQGLSKSCSLPAIGGARSATPAGAEELN